MTEAQMYEANLLTPCYRAEYEHRHAGVLAFVPSSVIRRIAVEPSFDMDGYVHECALTIVDLPASERTESILVDKLVDLAHVVPKKLQETFITQMASLIEKCNMVAPKVDEIDPVLKTKYNELKCQWHKSIMQNPISRMMYNGSWSWANVVEAEDAMYPERKIEYEARVKALAEEEKIHESNKHAIAMEHLQRCQRLIKDNRNPSLRLGNLYRGVTEEALKNVFAEFGKITRINVPKSRETGETRGFAFIDYANPKDAAKAYIACNDIPVILEDETVRVEFAASELRKK